ncbi:metallophosphoesterase family protein [Planococcus shixiaomingii]|uniref:metallophosphoesterase family protein n=1 Tax=Planococcus shixiaomingii TaxID=3058393 RepID=UPI00261393D5|nr:metallophosphoesterase family protein [Planococcus sp. N022]WKA56616.1 metallophosphoesterase family protein [Planococcus sp. N022]
MLKRVAAIYDIHGNLAALDAVLADIEKCRIDAIIVGGDLAWGPQPAMVMSRLMSLKGNVHFIKGNADGEVAERYGIGQGLDEETAEINEWCSDQLTATQKAFLRNLQEKMSVEIDGLGEVLFVHGSPRSDEEGIRNSTTDAAIKPMIDSVKQKTIVCGHTHVQFDRSVFDKRIINAGSVGLQINAKGACWVLLGPDVVFRETEYDFHYAADQIRQSGVPMANDFAEHILNPPKEGP